MNLIDIHLEQLAGLAAGLCLDARVRLEASPAGWCYVPERRVIRVSADDLARKGAVYCAGVLAHEVGHFHISRYHQIRIAYPSRTVLNQILNGIEDPRVNGWIKQRYPGTRPWFARLAEEDGLRPLSVRLPLVVWYCIECAREELIDWRPAPEVNPLPPPLADALDRTRAARCRYAATLPSPHLLPDDDLVELGRRYRESVTPCLEQADRVSPQPWERTARLSTVEAIRVAVEDILPHTLVLLDMDVDRLGRFLERDENLERTARKAVGSSDGDAAAKLIKDCFDCDPPGEEPATPLAVKFRKVALRVLEEWLRGQNRAMVGVGDPLLPGDCDATPPGRGRPAPSQPREKQLSAASDYEKMRSAVAVQIDRLVSDLEEVLRPRKRLRTRSGYATGQRLDLRRAMNFEADPRAYDRLWSRPTIPERRDTAFLLLVDLSGSMRGAKSDAALAGTILLAETLNRLGVPFAVHGFQDEVIPFCSFGDGLSLPTRANLGTMPREVHGDRDGGHNKPSHNDDGPCLLESARELLDRTATERLLIVVSDGLPEGRRSGPDDLKQAVRTLTTEHGDLKLIGVGLGVGTGHVRDFYPESVADVPADRFAAEIGKLLRAALTHA